MTESRDFIRGNGRGVILRSGRDQEAPPPAPALIPIKMITSLGKLGGPGGNGFIWWAMSVNIKYTTHPVWLLTDVLNAEKSKWKAEKGVIKFCPAHTIHHPAEFSMKQSFNIVNKQRRAL